ncbi:MAG: hypothetical protein AAFX93_12310 [Verrucomicrobiota bacterium]
MEFINRENAASMAYDLGLPDVVLGIINNQIPERIADYISTPMVYSLDAAEQDAYGYGRILPLMAVANSSIVYAYDFSRRDYFGFFWDGDIESRYESWNDLMREVVARTVDVVWDDQDRDEVFEILLAIFDGFEIDNLEEIFNDICNSSA